MKKFLLILLASLLVLTVFAGCGSKEDPAPQETSSESVTEAKPVMPEIEYTDVTSLMFGELLGKNVDACGLPQDSVFLTGDYVTGFDYMCMGDITGNLTCYLGENGITSYVFGSDPFDNVESFSDALNVVNDSIAGGLGQKVASTEFYGGSDEDQMEALFSGQGTVKAEYKTDTVTVTVTGCGVNDVATIVVECSANRTEG